jgi:hypothetical protein
MTALVVSACMTGTGGIVVLASFCGTPRKVVKEGLQVLGLGLGGIGTTLGFWSVLADAGEKGLGWLIIGYFVFVSLLSGLVVRLAREVPPDDGDQCCHHDRSNPANDEAVLEGRADFS